LKLLGVKSAIAVDVGLEGKEGNGGGEVREGGGGWRGEGEERNGREEGRGEGEAVPGQTIFLTSSFLLSVCSKQG
jgi:hypothetical protein